MRNIDMGIKAILTWIKSILGSKNTTEKDLVICDGKQQDALDNLMYGMTNDTDKGQEIETKKTFNH